MTQKSSSRTANSPGTSSASYSPSVPISIYREVVAELQATKTTIETLKAQNQQLTKHNQLLRQEIEKAVQASLQLRQVSNAMQPAETPQIEVPEPEPVLQVPVMPRVPVTKSIAPVPPEDRVIEQDSKPRRKLQLEKESTPDLGGWWMVLAIALIIVTAFGAGFMLVRPLLSPASK